jgi:hypothetical protein
LLTYKEAAKRANLDGAWSSSRLLLCRVNSHTFVNVQEACLCWCVWLDSMTIGNNVMDKLSPSLMDKLTFCNNYLYSYGQVIFISVDKLTLLWCLFCLRRYVCWLCLYVEMEAMRDRVDLLVRTDSKETMIHKPLSNLFTTAVLLLHVSEECSQTLIIGLSD